MTTSRWHDRAADHARTRDAIVRDLRPLGFAIDSDIGGAAPLGLRTVIVRAGKSRSGDESRGEHRPDRVVEDLPAAVDARVRGDG